MQNLDSHLSKRMNYLHILAWRFCSENSLPLQMPKWNTRARDGARAKCRWQRRKTTSVRRGRLFCYLLDHAYHASLSLHVYIMFLYSKAHQYSFSFWNKHPPSWHFRLTGGVHPRSSRNESVHNASCSSFHCLFLFSFSVVFARRLLEVKFIDFMEQT